MPARCLNHVCNAHCVNCKIVAALVGLQKRGEESASLLSEFQRFVSVKTLSNSQDCFLQERQVAAVWFLLELREFFGASLT